MTKDEAAKSRQMRKRFFSPRSADPPSAPEWDLPPQANEEFVERIKAIGLGKYADGLVALTRKGLRLEPSEGIGDPENAPVRLGERPRLPIDIEWPRREDGTPMSFIAHITIRKGAMLTIMTTPTRRQSLPERINGGCYCKSTLFVLRG